MRLAKRQNNHNRRTQMKEKHQADLTRRLNFLQIIILGGGSFTKVVYAVKILLIYKIWSSGSYVALLIKPSIKIFIKLKLFGYLAKNLQILITLLVV